MSKRSFIVLLISFIVVAIFVFLYFYINNQGIFNPNSSNTAVVPASNSNVSSTPQIVKELTEYTPPSKDLKSTKQITKELYSFKVSTATKTSSRTDLLKALQSVQPSSN
ncbi:MAG: hypothetical protein V4439_01715 [Patescibacteria group bacterium]